jgi:hypothetical protein
MTDKIGVSVRERWFVELWEASRGLICGEEVGGGREMGKGGCWSVEVLAACEAEAIFWDLCAISGCERGRKKENGANK